MLHPFQKNHSLHFRGVHLWIQFWVQEMLLKFPCLLVKVTACCNILDIFISHFLQILVAGDILRLPFTRDNINLVSKWYIYTYIYKMHVFPISNFTTIFIYIYIYFFDIGKRKVICYSLPPIIMVHWKIEPWKTIGVFPTEPRKKPRGPWLSIWILVVWCRDPYHIASWNNPHITG